MNKRMPLWTIYHALRSRLNGNVQQDLRDAIDAIAAKNDKIHGIKAGVFFYQSKKYPEHRGTPFGVAVPSLSEELYPEMERWLVLFVQETKEEALSNALLQAIVFTSNDRVILASRIPTILHKDLFHVIGPVPGPYPESGMSELAEAANLPPEACDAFKLRVMRLLLE